MAYESERRDEIRMDRDIANAKGVACFRKYQETGERRWMELAAGHFNASSGLSAELDSIGMDAGERISYLGADQSVRCGTEVRLVEGNDCRCHLVGGGEQVSA